MTYDLPDGMTITSRGPIRTLTLDRPDKRNAITADMLDALADIWLQLRRDPEARAVIFTGAGDVFCAGGDMALIARNSEDADYRYARMANGRRIVTEMMACPLPLIAAVNGPAVGLGCSLALFCDVVLMSDEAFLADPHVTIGLVAADGGVLAWPLLTSLLRAKEYLLSGDRISAVEAERIGLANHVYPRSDLMAEANAFADRLASQPRQALQDTKRALNLHLSSAVMGVLDFAFSAESEGFASEDFRKTLDRYRSGTERAS